MVTSSGWPFLDSVIVMGSELTGVCGSLTVTVYEAGTTNVATYVDFDPQTGVMSFSPELGDPTGAL